MLFTIKVDKDLFSSIVEHGKRQGFVLIKKVDTTTLICRITGTKTELVVSR